MELAMRTRLLLSIAGTLATLAACDNNQPTTAPATSAHLTPAPSAQVGDAATGQARAAGNGLTVTVVTSSDITVPGGAVAGSVLCPAGTTRIGGGYAMSNEGGWEPFMVSQNQPFGNGWWVRVIKPNVNPNPVVFKVYALCAS
jgi:hypothetical protein